MGHPACHATRQRVSKGSGDRLCPYARYKRPSLQRIALSSMFLLFASCNYARRSPRWGRLPPNKKTRVETIFTLASNNTWDRLRVCPAILRRAPIHPLATPAVPLHEHLRDGTHTMHTHLAQSPALLAISVCYRRTPFAPVSCSSLYLEAVLLA